MKFLRHCLFAIVLLRLLTGTAWAMPSVVIPPCHEETQEIQAVQAVQAIQEMNDDCANECVLLCDLCCDLCCMGFIASVPVIKISASLFPQISPSHPAQTVARWQNTPDLRPPIEIL